MKTELLLRKISKMSHKFYLGSYLNPKPFGVSFLFCFILFSVLDKRAQKRGVSGTTNVIIYFVLYDDDSFDDERVFDDRR